MSRTKEKCIVLNETTQKQEHILMFITKLYNQLGSAISQLEKYNVVHYTLKEWLNEYYNTYKTNSVSKSHLNQIRVCIQYHISEELKALPLNLVTPLDIERTLCHVNTSRNRESTYMVLSEAFKVALENDFILINPMLKIPKVKHLRNSGSSLTQNEIAYLLQNADINYRRFFEFLLNTGCRKNEALQLKLSDVDLLNDTVHVKGTKTAASDRYIPLFPAVKQILNTIDKENVLIFPDIDYYKCSKIFHKILPNHKLHDARHTFSTRCLECGISMKVVQKWLGHTRIETTSQIYTHILPDYVKTEADKFSLFR